MTTKTKKQKATEVDQVRARGQALKIPFKDITGKRIPPEVLREIPEEAATFYQFVPIVRRGKALEVGMVNPDDLKAREALRFIALRNDLETEIFIITPSNFQEVIRHQLNNRVLAVHSPQQDEIADLS